MKGIMNSGQRELVVSNLNGQIEALENLVKQIEENSMFDQGPGWGHEEVASVEGALRRIRKLAETRESKNELLRLRLAW
jgi:hypothetical protein